MRTVLVALLSLLTAPAIARAAEPDTARFCKPTQPCWPTPAEWARLRAALHGTLETPRAPLQPCVDDPASPACAAALVHLRRPYDLQRQSGGTESLGWLDAWTATPSARAVVAADAADVATAVRFARAHRLRLVVKGTGHDYLGRSSAPDSLLVWTHRMRAVRRIDAFVPAGCPATQAGVPAVSVGAGARWLEVYQEVTTRGHRYAQGGGCLSVGAAGGFLQGGGFGSWSKKYGIAAASLLEAEVVTADGRVRIANACSNPDLFWALRGGGGGTFGIVTRATLATHPLPRQFGVVTGMIRADTDAAFIALLQRFLVFYGARLDNEHWGEKVTIGKDDTLELSLLYEGMSAAEVEALWKPFRAWVEARAPHLTMQARVLALPAEKMWDPSFLTQKVPGVVRPDGPGSPLWWWRDNDDEVGIYWIAYQSRWIPVDRFHGAAAARFARVLFDASRHFAVTLHFNKGQAGASPEALARGRQTSMNPAVFDAAALAIIATGTTALPGVRGHEVDRAQAAAQRAEVTAAMKIIRDATPGAGSYVNETDYFEPDWKREFWGANYPRLLAIKHKYDPDGLFVCHHCVGSDERSGRERDR